MKRSLWKATAARNVQLHVAPLTAKKIAQVRKAVAEAAKGDPFTTKICPEVFYRPF